MNEKESITRESVPKGATSCDESRHAGSIPVARSYGVSSILVEDYEFPPRASVEPSVEFPSLLQSAEDERRVERKPKDATEAGHWYLPDGTPYYTTPRRSGPKKGEERPVSLRHDRALMLKLGVVPSSTGITRQLDAPALNAYRERHIFEATLQLMPDYRIEVERMTDDERKQFFNEVKQAASEHRIAAAERGTSLHTAIEAMLRGDAPSDRWRKHCEKLWDTLEQYGIDLTQGESERSFAHPLGYGGKCDYHEIELDGLGYPNGGGLVIDFKSKDEIELDEKGKLVKQLVGDEHVMQIASYANGLNIPNARGINVFIGENDERIWIHEWNASDLRRGWQLFQLLLRVWKIKNNYYPTKQ